MNDSQSLFLLPKSACGALRHKLLHRLLLPVLMRVHPGGRGCGPCSSRMLSLGARVCPAPEPLFPVDVVYTWVDGSDPAHARKRADYLPGQTAIHDNGLEHARFRDNEELRYSLRALAHFAPWVRRVIVVTDAQIPGWLSTENDRLRIVDHRDFIPAEYLPTFNSHVIEAFLHRIPGLAEHYIYLNDDVFLARHCRKSEFFTPNGLPLAFVDWRARRLFGYKFTKTPHAQSYFNTLRILEQRGVPTEPAFITAHGPYPQTISNAGEAFAFYQDIIEGFAHNRFRTSDEVAFYSHALPLWMYGRKRLVPCDERYYYVQTRRRDRLAYYSAILRAKAEHAAPLFFCINDVGNHSADARWQEDLRILLTTYYPHPSPFERAVSGQADII